MIFTEEQIERLPGSTVRLRDGRNDVVRRVGRRCDDDGVYYDVYGDDRWMAAMMSKGRPVDGDIIEVIQWADQPEAWDGVIRAGRDYRVRVGVIGPDADLGWSLGTDWRETLTKRPVEPEPNHEDLRRAAYLGQGPCA